MKLKFVFHAIGLLLVLGDNCNAGIVISIDRVTAVAGQSILLGVYASSDSGDEISGFNLPFDYNSDGFVDIQNDGFGDLPTGFTFSVMPVSNATYLNTGLDRPKPQIQLVDVDTIVTGTGDNIRLGDSLNPTRLFNLVIESSSTVPVGTVVPFQIKVPDQPFTSLFNVAGPNVPRVTFPTPGSPATGSITIVAVPEPSSVILFLSVGAASLGIRRLRRRVAKAACLALQIPVSH